jgi:hypothetical protein
VNHDAALIALRNCTQWQKSSYSFPDGEECVEITTELPGWVGVRDSKLGTRSPVLAATAAQWTSVIAAVRAGKLEL